MTCTRLPVLRNKIYFENRCFLFTLYCLHVIIFSVVDWNLERQIWSVSRSQRKVDGFGVWIPPLTCVEFAFSLRVESVSSVIKLRGVSKLTVYCVNDCMCLVVDCHPVQDVLQAMSLALQVTPPPLPGVPDQDKQSWMDGQYNISLFFILFYFFPRPLDISTLQLLSAMSYVYNYRPVVLWNNLSCMQYQNICRFLMSKCCKNGFKLWRC